MRIGIFLSIICTGVLAVFDGYIDWPVSAGTATSAVSSGAKSLWANPSGIKSDGSFQVDFSADRGWGLSELVTGKVSFSRNLLGGHIALGGSFTGDPELYTESMGVLAYSRIVGSITMGAKASFGMVNSDDWNAKGLFLGLGLMIPFGEILEYGVWADNLTMSKMDGNAIPIRGSTGFLIAPTDWIDLSTDVYFEGDKPLTLRMGQQMELGEIIFIRSGVVFQPNSYHFGLGAHYKNFELYWSYIGHPDLGGSTLLGLTYRGIRQ